MQLKKCNCNGNNCNSLDKNNQYLFTISEKDKVWDIHKAENDEITEIFKSVLDERENENKYIFKKWAERTKACAEWLGFIWEGATREEIRLKLKTANFCRVRTCPICSWRRSLKNKARLLERLPKVQENYFSSRWLFLTLTVRNCDISKLKETIKAMNKGFIAMKRIKKWKSIGWIKTIEVTRDKDGLAHPHFHILLHMPASYFQGKNYIKQSDWILIWKKAMKLNYQPNVDIRAIKPNERKGKKDLISVISEIAKYATKPTTFIDYPEWFKIYCIQIHRMRFIDTGGTLRGILSDDYKDLIKIDENKDEEEEQKKEQLIFDWSSNNKRYMKK